MGKWSKSRANGKAQFEEMERRSSPNWLMLCMYQYALCRRTYVRALMRAPMTLVAAAVTAVADSSIISSERSFTKPY